MLLLVLSCGQQKENYDWSWVDDLGKDYPPELEGFNEKWMLSLTNVVDPSIYVFDGSASLLSTYTEEKDMDKVLKVAEVLDSRILPLFPTEMVTRNMPSLIYVADSVCVDYVEERYDAKPNDKGVLKPFYPSETLKRSLYGDVGASQLTLAAAKLDEPGAQDSLVFNWTSLIIERMMANTTKWPVLQEFKALSEQKYSSLGLFTTNRYYQDALSNGKKYFRSYASLYSDQWSYWYACGSVRGSRYFYDSRCVFTTKFAEYYNSFMGDGMGYDEIQCWYWLTYRQDFADLLTFMLLNTPAEREAWLDKVEPLRYTEFQMDDDVMAISRDIFHQKMELVRNYMQEHFNWTIE